MEYSVMYLGHSSWMVTAQDHCFIFDYGDLPCIKETVLDFDKLIDKKVILFFSHDHFDHYSKDLLEKSRAYPNVRIILGDFASDAPNLIRIAPHERVNLEDVEVFTAGSTDAGVCFLIKLKDMSIYFGGDNADWGNGDEINKEYYPEIDYISGLIKEPVSIAFIPVCRFSGERPSDLTMGAIYTIIKLDAQVTFPMHCNGKEGLLKDFEADYIKTGLKNKIICMKRGDIYTDKE